MKTFAQNISTARDNFLSASSETFLAWHTLIPIFRISSEVRFCGGIFFDLSLSAFSSLHLVQCFLLRAPNVPTLLTIRTFRQPLSHALSHFPVSGLLFSFDCMFLVSRDCRYTQYQECLVYRKHPINECECVYIMQERIEKPKLRAGKSIWEVY